MSLFERILVPLDGSELAEGILPRVRSILRYRDAEVILASAVSVTPLEEATVGLRVSAFQERAEAYLEDLERRLAGEGVRVRHVVGFDSPAEMILKTAESEDASLIAISTHGRSGVARWVMGSVAEKVLRASRVPVLLVRALGDSRPVRRILLPVDIGEATLAVVPAAAELARLFGSRVSILHVCEGHPQCALPVESMTEAHDILRTHGVEVEPIMRMGNAAEQILAAATEEGMDLIAMSTHGRGGLSRWVLGSVAEKVLRTSTVPMLMVRSAVIPSAKQAPWALP